MAKEKGSASELDEPFFTSSELDYEVALRLFRINWNVRCQNAPFVYGLSWVGQFVQ